MGEGVDIKQAALDLAARGFRVFPLVPGRKEPAFGGWKDMATTDPARIRQWWSGQPDLVIGFTKDGREVLAHAAFNVGVATGGGLLVADADVKKGKDGPNTAKGLGVGFTGFVVRTPTGGLHEYLRGPDVANSAGTLGDGLDIRSAGGFVVGPGSVVDGVAYTLEVANDLQPVPPALIQRCIGLLERRSAEAPVVTPDSPGAVDRAIDYLDRAPLAVEGTGGDLTTFKVAATLKDYGVSEDMAIDLMAEHWNDRCSPSWPLDDLKVKVRNAYEYGARPVGDLHPMADFKDVKAVAPPAEAPRAGRPWFHHGDTVGKVDWLYYQMMPKVGVGLLTAESQAGKTFLAVNLAHSLATGGAFFKEQPDDRGATLFLFAGTEGSGFPMRLDALKAEGRLPVSATIVGDLSAANALPNLLEDLRAEARWLLAEFGLPVRLIVLETMAAAALLNDENDNAEAGRAMANLATIAREMGAFVLTSHHPAKDGKSSRGASAIPNAADYVMEIKRDGEIRELALVKARDAEQRKLGAFTLLPVELGHDDRGRPVTSMVISSGEPTSTATRAAPHAEKLLEALEWASMEEGEDVGGRIGVEESLARDMFKDRKGGSRDRSNVLKTFKAAKSWLQQIGRLDVVAVGTETFLVLKQPVEVAP